MLKQRIITGTLLILFSLFILFYFTRPQFCIATALLMLWGTWEWTKLMSLRRTLPRLAYVALMAACLFGALFVPVALILGMATCFWLIALLLVFFYPTGSRWWGKGVVLRGVMGLFVLLPCWAALNEIRQYHDGLPALIFLFVLIWGADSVAFFVGKKWGKHRLAPRVSPLKSIEGVVGACVFAILYTIAALIVMHAPFALWGWVILFSCVVVLFSVVGDLFESMLKRQVNLKDVSQLLPGHGGLLDRIDSLLAAAPLFAFGALLFRLYL
jgi:phosphatidate cytidylyltransferase